MTDESPPPLRVPVTYAPRRRGDWNGVAAVIAAAVGLLALCVSGYTAYLQRQQVRAQVWPYLEVGNDDGDQSLDVYNKGVGPAIIGNAQVFVDGKPLPDWNHVLPALGISPRSFRQSTLNPGVFAPNEQQKMIKFPDKDKWEQFRAAAEKRMTMDICFCSTLGECWMYRDRHPVGYKELGQLVTPIGQCPRLPEADVFNN